jgi:hypothetical protein
MGGCGCSWFLAVMQLVCGDVYDTYEDLGRREILDREDAEVGRATDRYTSLTV